MPDDFDTILPSSITAVSVRSGNEWVIPLPQVNEAIKLASEHLIAILGVEAFHIEEIGLRVENYTGYDFEFLGDWPTCVRQNNHAALQFIEKNELGKGYGYILTTTSEKEFENLGRQVRDARSSPHPALAQRHFCRVSLVLWDRLLRLFSKFPRTSR